MSSEHNKEYDEKEQCQLAAEAQESTEAKQKLVASLSPLTDHIINAYLDKLGDSGHASSELTKTLADIVETALDKALIAYNNDSSYKIGTHYSWLLREGAACWFKKYSAVE